MLYLEANSQVRTPKVYAVFTHNGIHYLVMEFLEGEVLSDERWLSFSVDARTKILSRLCEQLHLLRSIPSPGYYGRVHRQGWRPDCNLFCASKGQMCGPYNNYRDMLSASIHKLKVQAVTCYDNPKFLGKEIEYITQFESTLATCSGHEPTFTHPDPALHNIIARPIRDGEDWEVTLIDWEDSGWHPAWMQAVAFRLRLDIVDKQEINREETDHFVGKVLESFGESYSEQFEVFEQMLFTLHYTTM
jgi:aminoglycoside phosphotransferase (APT) family kinase protein